MALLDSDYFGIRDKIFSGEITVPEITEACLAEIEAEKDLNAFISVFPEHALKRAKQVDQKIRSGHAGKLAGMVVGIKDNLNLKGYRTTCGSHILDNFISSYDATVVRRLLEEDAVIIGKTNMDEFAMGSSNETSYFGRVKNYHDSERIPGGSSGGSATAVAANMVMAALGSDTGGSIRQPAALCGVVGLKPTYGRVSRFGLVAFASSLDQIGPLSKSIKDAALLLNVISGYDPNDSTSVKQPVPDFTEDLKKSVKGLKIGCPKEYLGEGLDPEVRKAIENALKLLENEGAIVEEISLPHTEYAIAAYYILATAEASSNLARYDGARYGFRSSGIRNLEEMYTKSRSAGFGDEVKRRIMLGTYVLSAGYYEAYYRKAQKVRTLIKQDFEDAFKKYDVIVTPTSPTTAFKLGEKMDDPLQMYLSDIYTISANLAGIAGLSLPCGKDSGGLPIGMQILGKPFDEKTVLRTGQSLEDALK
ncbi:MAG TPA: Asp-tRNA(Asn)/Glu-tRNA(Gln) amidotransferase subunit GatA [Bacteroidetes bacterium]|nr:Asp-tRNA(Asn)/Glu-tRNA(Gln) amidotransferase subunit GatA [Bacteroidota bacterium]